MKADWLGVVVSALTSATLLLASTHARAVRFERSFTGLASGTLSFEAFENAPLTGTFSLVVDEFPPAWLPDEQATSFRLPIGSIELTYSVQGQDFFNDGTGGFFGPTLVLSYGPRAWHAACESLGSSRPGSRHAASAHHRVTHLAVR